VNLDLKKAKVSQRLTQIEEKRQDLSLEVVNISNCQKTCSSHCLSFKQESLNECLPAISQTTHDQRGASSGDKVEYFRNAIHVFLPACWWFSDGQFGHCVCKFPSVHIERKKIPLKFRIAKLTPIRVSTDFTARWRIACMRAVFLSRSWALRSKREPEKTRGNSSILLENCSEFSRRH
jgi:hypothetical protein